MRFTLVKALVASRKSSSGKVGTPVLGYSLLDNETKEVGVYTKFNAYRCVQEHGATNCEAKTREAVINGEDVRVFYLKPNNGTKMTDYLLSVE
ncbi:hypothetical protein Thu_135 [Bacillus phage Thurquoise]|nr:hypothetical protein Thu_135 [Bacillus phage Thurquoise]